MTSYADNLSRREAMRLMLGGLACAAGLPASSTLPAWQYVTQGDDSVRDEHRTTTPDPRVIESGMAWDDVAKEWYIVPRSVE